MCVLVRDVFCWLLNCVLRVDVVRRCCVLVVALMCCDVLIWNIVLVCVLFVDVRGRLCVVVFVFCVI